MFPVSRFTGRFRTKTSRAFWTPSKLSTEMWLDAADASTVTLNGSTVSQWNDKSGFGRNLAQSTQSAQPAYQTDTFNGKPTLVFDGSNDVMFCGSTALMQNVSGGSMFAVYRWRTVPTVASSAMVVLSGAGSARFQIGSTITLGRLETAGRRLDANPYEIAATSAQNIVALHPYLHASVITYSSALGQQYINGTLNGQNTSFQTAGNTSNTASTSFLIGAVNSIGAQPAAIDVSEFLILNSAASVETRQRTEGYLAWKWGLEGNLPANHPYKLLPPTA